MHFTGVIECIILLDRLKNFSSILKKALKISPKKITFALLCICLLIDFPPVFQYSGHEFDYNYYGSDGQIQLYKIYLVITSEIASSYIGSSIEVAIFVIRDGVTLVFSIGLNIICFYYMKNHSAKKHVLTNDTSTSRAIVTISAHAIDSKKEREKTFQKNMSQMTITLVLISTLVRITTLTCGIYWLFAYDLISVILGMFSDSAVALNATVPFFVFLRFNKKYRRIFLDLVLGPGKKRNVTGKTNSQSNRADQYAV
jgi:hypothetical protein